VAVSGKVQIVAMLASIIVPIGLLTTFRAAGVMQPSRDSSVETPPVELNVTEHPIKLYVVCLDGVGSGLDANISRVLEGVLKATTVNSTAVSMGADYYYCRISFQVDTTIVRDWGTYRSLIENAGNITIVNVHNEILPVPDGYTKEEWTAKISDFLIYRWGSWVHTGGQPFKYVQYQNGTLEEWGMPGFSNFMSHMGKNNETCLPPEPVNVTEKALAGMCREFHPSTDWWGFEGLTQAQMNRPLNYDDLSQNLITGIYGDPINGTWYFAGAVVQYKPVSAFSFGYYVHLGTLRFCDGYGPPIDNRTNEFGLGYVPTAAAIWTEVGLNAYYAFADVITETYKAQIRTAQIEGRTQGLDDAFRLGDEARQQYMEGHYKQSFAYAYKAFEAAESSTRPAPSPPLTLLAIGTVTMILIVALTYHVTKNKKKRTQ
jgi:hypothetical protein